MAEFVQKCSFNSLMCTTVLELFILLGVVIYWRERRNEMLTPKQHQFCYPRDQLFSTEENESCPDPLKEQFNETRNATMCCGAYGTVITELVKKNVPDRYNSDTNPEMSRLNLTDYNCYIDKEIPSAVILGLAADRKSVQVGTSHKIFWNPSKASNKMPGLTHLPDDGSVYVKQTGLYYVFSQIKMKLGSTNDTDYNRRPFAHYILHISHHGIGKILLENAKSQCTAVEEESEVTLASGAVFNLEEGDRVYVATSHPEHLTSDRNNNYFGIHSIK